MKKNNNHDYSICSNFVRNDFKKAHAFLKFYEYFNNVLLNTFLARFSVNVIQLISKFTLTVKTTDSVNANLLTISDAFFTLINI